MTFFVDYQRLTMCRMGKNHVTSISCKIFHQIRKGRLFHVFFCVQLQPCSPHLGVVFWSEHVFGGSRIGYTFVYPNVLRFFHIFPHQKRNTAMKTWVFPERSLPHRCDSRNGLDGICRHWTNCKNPLTPFKAAELTDRLI